MTSVSILSTNGTWIKKPAVNVRMNIYCTVLHCRSWIPSLTYLQITWWKPPHCYGVLHWYSLETVMEHPQVFSNLQKLNIKEEFWKKHSCTVSLHLQFYCAVFWRADSQFYCALLHSFIARCCTVLLRGFPQFYCALFHRFIAAMLQLCLEHFWRNLRTTVSNDFDKINYFEPFRR